MFKHTLLSIPIQIHFSGMKYKVISAVCCTMPAVNMQITQSAYVHQNPDEHIVRQEGSRERKLSGESLALLREWGNLSLQALRACCVLSVCCTAGFQRFLPVC